MSCPTKSHIPEAVWDTHHGQIKDVADAQIGMMGYVLRYDMKPQTHNFIIVWVGDYEIGAIFPFLCPMNCGSYAFGPDSLSDESVWKFETLREYNVKKLNPKVDTIFSGTIST